jgi:hypothetical protein
MKAYTHMLTESFTLTGLLASFLLTMDVVYTPIYPHFSAFLYVKDFTIVRWCGPTETVNLLYLVSHDLGGFKMPRLMQIKGRDMNNTGLTLAASRVVFYTFVSISKKGRFWT